MLLAFRPENDPISSLKDLSAPFDMMFQVTEEVMTLKYPYLGASSQN